MKIIERDYTFDKDEVWGFVKKVNGGFMSVSAMGSSHCKAYMWDKFTEFAKNPDTNPSQLYIVYKGGIYSKQTIEEVKERLERLEEILNLHPRWNKIRQDTKKERVVVNLKNKFWTLCVENFSLLLAAMRYSNNADKRGYDAVIENPKKLLDYQTTLDKDWRVNWERHNGHGEGIANFYGVY